MIPQPLREQIEGNIMARGGVTPRNMMGTTAFMVNGRMFAFWVADGLVLKVPSDAHRELMESLGALPFQGPGGSTFGEWVRVPLAGEGDLEGCLSAVGRAYDYVKGHGGAPRAKARKKGRRG